MDAVDYFLHEKTRSTQSCLSVTQESKLSSLTHTQGPDPDTLPGMFGQI